MLIIENIFALQMIIYNLYKFNYIQSRKTDSNAFKRLWIDKSSVMVFQDDAKYWNDALTLPKILVICCSNPKVNTPAAMEGHKIKYTKILSNCLYQLLIKLKYT